MCEKGVRSPCTLCLSHQKPLRVQLSGSPPGPFFFLIFRDVFNGDFTSYMIVVWIAMLNSDRKGSIYTECGHPARHARLVGPPF